MTREMLRIVLGIRTVRVRVWCRRLGGGSGPQVRVRARWMRLCCSLSGIRNFYLSPR